MKKTCGHTSKIPMLHPFPVRFYNFFFLIKKNFSCKKLLFHESFLNVFFRCLSIRRFIFKYPIHRYNVGDLITVRKFFDFVFFIFFLGGRGAFLMIFKSYPALLIALFKKGWSAMAQDGTRECKITLYASFGTFHGCKNQIYH